MTVVTNIDYEHLERYEGFADLTDAFVAFASKAPFYGAAVLCTDDEHVRAIVPRVTSPRRDLRHRPGRRRSRRARRAALGRRQPRDGRAAARRSAREREHAGHARVSRVPGRHNLQNALAAVAVALELGMPFETIAAGLAAFAGVERRFERKGCGGRRGRVRRLRPPPDRDRGSASRRANRTHAAGSSWRSSRTGTRARGSCVTSSARRSRWPDAIVLTGIYAAGEDPMPGVTIEWLADAVAAAAPGRVDPGARPRGRARGRGAASRDAGDLVITMGAGSIGDCGARILEELRRCAVAAPADKRFRRAHVRPPRRRHSWARVLGDRAQRGRRSRCFACRRVPAAAAGGARKRAARRSHRRARQRAAVDRRGARPARGPSRAAPARAWISTAGSGA